MGQTVMATKAHRSFRLLEPIDRVSEILFGLVMVLAGTSTLSVVSAGRAEVKTMIVGALGCNLAWGVIDGALYLLGSLDEQARNLHLLRGTRNAGKPEAAHDALVTALPDPVAAVLSRDELESIRQKITQLPAPPSQPRLTRDDMLGAAAVCLLVFVSTFPVVLPFFFVSDVRLALRISNTIAIGMLFLCGYLYATYAGFRPWRTGLAMVAIGCAMVGIAVALGG